MVTIYITISICCNSSAMQNWLCKLYVRVYSLRTI